MTGQEAKQLVAMALVAVPHHRVPADAVPHMGTVWAELLRDIPYTVACAALRALLETKPWLPAVADLRSAALELQNGRRKTGTEAWGELVRLVGRWGAYRTPGDDFEIPDPVTAVVVRALDWRTLCLSENPVADRARFIEAYERIATDERRQAQSPTLAAASEQRRIGGQPQHAGDLFSSAVKRIGGGS